MLSLPPLEKAKEGNTKGKIRKDAK